MAGGTSPLAYQWSCNGTNLDGATNVSLTLTNIQPSQAGNYAVVVTNAYGSALSPNAVLMVAIPSTLDSFNPGANGSVYCTAVQADGKILAGGQFTLLGGQSRTNIGRLNADGTLDTNFNPEASGTVNSLAVQTDGKILAGGQFTTLGGQSRAYIGRLNADGTLDTNFNPGASSYVYSLALQADGKILVGGQFTTLGGQSHSRIGRLNADGTLDTNFNPVAGTYVYSLALQADGKILVGGRFATLGGQSHSRIGRLNADGTLDTSFNPGATIYNDLPCYVYSLAVQADGKILVGGQFTGLNGQNCTNIGRLNADGTLDYNFYPGALHGLAVYSLAVEADGGILVGGQFTALGGQSCTNIGRFNADGTLDNNFYPGANNTVYSLAVQADGKILAGGAFTTLGGQSRTNIGRLIPTVPATQSLTFDGSTINWQRSGSSPEVWRTSFDGATNGTSWMALGAGTRVAGGWQLTGLAWPTNASLRARGFVTGGEYNGSGWFVETMTGPPIITNQPINQTVLVGGTATFTVLADGTPALSYQWNFNGTNISGATNTTLTLTNVQLIQTGNYAVQVSNAFGSVLSSNTVLTVGLPPTITVQPTNQTAAVGGTAIFLVMADGTPTLSYQWNFNGTNLAWATNTSLIITNVQPCQAGNYAVLVTNVFGSSFSSNATLTVTLNHLTWNQIPSPRFVNTPIAVTLQARDATNGLFTNFTGTVLLGSTNGVAVTPPVSGNFVQGVWTGTVVIVQPVTNLVLEAGDGLGHIGLANPINVVSPPDLVMLQSGNIALFVWPAGYTGFVLESSGSLSPTVWVPVPCNPIQFGGQCLVPLEMHGTNCFYRLRFSDP